VLSAAKLVAAEVADVAAEVAEVAAEVSEVAAEVAETCAASLAASDAPWIPSSVDCSVVVSPDPL
jgi:hypothetical protein